MQVKLEGQMLKKQADFGYSNEFRHIALKIYFCLIYRKCHFEAKSYE